MKNRSKKWDWMGWLLPVVMCIIWIICTERKGYSGYALPSPRQLGRMLVDFATGSYGLTTYAGQLWMHLSKSTARVLQGFLLAGGLGMLMGFLTGRSNWCRKLLDPMLQAVRAIPGIGFLPISIVWFGVGEKNTLFLITLAAFFPIYLNTQEGISNVPTEYIRSGQMSGAKGISLFATVIFPAAFPQIFIGLRLGLGVAWAYLVLGEMTGVSQGIGAVMMNGRMLGNVELVMTGMIVIAVMGKLADCILLQLYRLFYEKRSKNDGR